MRRPWRKRYQVVIVGTYSGRTIPLSWCRFRSRDQATAFADRLNSNVRAADPKFQAMTRFEVRERGTG